VYLLAAGAVAVDGWLHARTGRLRNVTLATTLTAGVFALLVLPVLPPTGIGPTHKMDQTLAETIGRPQLVDAVHTVWTSLPPRQRANAVIFTADYSEAGAINELGRGKGLPTAVSGHNSYWWWGPGNPGPDHGGGGSRPARPPPPATPPASGASSLTYARWASWPTHTAFSTSNPAATSTCAPAPASPGPSCGCAYGTTTGPRPTSPR